MLDVKTWLETTGLDVGLVSFESPPPLPYIVYMEDVDCFGSDLSNDLVDRSFAVELYSRKPGSNAENLIEALLDEKAFNYTKNTMWLSSERCHMTVYNFTFTERK